MTNDYRTCTLDPPVQHNRSETPRMRSSTHSDRKQIYQIPLVETLNNELKKVSLWFECNKLSLNVNKTSFLHFSNHNPKKYSMYTYFHRQPTYYRKKFYQILRSNT